jgi:hypothetical protein
MMMRPSSPEYPGISENPPKHRLPLIMITPPTPQKFDLFIVGNHLVDLAGTCPNQQSRVRGVNTC